MAQHLRDEAKRALAEVANPTTALAMLEAWDYADLCESLALSLDCRREFFPTEDECSPS